MEPVEAIRKYDHHVKYWIKRLNVPPYLVEDCFQEGCLQIITDAISLNDDDLNFKVSFHVAKSIGRFLAKGQGYVSLEQGKKKEWKNRPISLDVIIAEDINMIDPISYSMWNHSDKNYSEKWLYIYSKIEPLLSEYDKQLIKIIFHVPLHKAKLVKLDKNSKDRMIAQRSKEEKDTIRKLALKAGYALATTKMPKELEQTRNNLINKVRDLVNKLGIAEIEVTKNPNNRLKPIIVGVKIKEEYA